MLKLNNKVKILRILKSKKCVCWLQFRTSRSNQLRHCGLGSHNNPCQEVTLDSTQLTTELLWAKHKNYLQKVFNCQWSSSKGPGSTWAPRQLAWAPWVSTTLKLQGRWAKPAPPQPFLCHVSPAVVSFCFQAAVQWTGCNLPLHPHPQICLDKQALLCSRLLLHLHIVL